MSDKQDGAKHTKNVTPDELREAAKMPAIFVNKTIASISGSMARITFFERRDDDGGTHSDARVCVAMELSAFVELHKLTERLMVNIREVPLPQPLPEAADD